MSLYKYNTKLSPMDGDAVFVTAFIAENGPNLHGSHFKFHKNKYDDHRSDPKEYQQ